jgi:para-aminobenzoate synthetase/4-amino-4-deoxychorismate lyase
VRLSATPLDSSSVFLFHKTTRRDVYTRAREEAPELDEVLLWNERGEITEATTANVVVRCAGGPRVTPPVRCGLLAGTYRAEMLAAGEIVEAVLTREDLRAASDIWLINAIYEWRRAVLVP